MKTKTEKSRSESIRRREVLLKRKQKQNPKLLHTLARKCLSARSNLSHYNFVWIYFFFFFRKLTTRYFFWDGEASACEIATSGAMLLAVGADSYLCTFPIFLSLSFFICFFFYGALTFNLFFISLESHPQTPWLRF